MSIGEPHMSPDEFREYGHEVVDWIAGYMEQVREFPVLSQVAPGEIRGKLPAHPPVKGESFDQIFKDVDEIILPGITHWQSPNFYAYFPSNNSGPSILGELLSAGLAVQGMLWSTSPACTELESHVLDWLVEMLGLPDSFLTTSRGGGVILDSASSATLCALLAARDRATEGSVTNGGIERQITVYTSTQAHSSVEKAVRIAGIGGDNLRLIEVDSELAMRADALDAAISGDLAAGATPCCVVATVGTTSTLAFDDLRAIGEVCMKYGVWLHVDDAMAGTAFLCEEFRGYNDGVDLVDSWAFNPHKWMFTNWDCDCFWVADRTHLIQALSVLPEYLRNKATESGTVIDYRDWQIPLGRRFRALKLWFVIRHYGIEGLQQIIREHLRIAGEFANWVDASDQFELFRPFHLNLVCFSHKSGNEVTEQLLDRVNSTGKIFLTHTKIDGQTLLRFCVGQSYTTEADVQAAWALIEETAHEVA
jgi:aromatic-L-amino-acid decarboxylase